MPFERRLLKITGKVWLSPSKWSPVQTRQVTSDRGLWWRLWEEEGGHSVWPRTRLALGGCDSDSGVFCLFFACGPALWCPELEEGRVHLHKEPRNLLGRKGLRKPRPTLLLAVGIRETALVGGGGPHRKLRAHEDFLCP